MATPGNLPDIVALAIPAFMMLIAAEMFWARRYARQSYHPSDLLTSMALGLTAFAAGAWFADAVGFAAAFFSRYRMVSLPFIWWAWLACFIADDFLHYALHRASHRIRVLWASHVVHHSSQHFNLVIGLRQSPVIVYFSALVFRAPLMLAGFPAEMVALVITANQIYQFWTHSAAILQSPRWFGALFVTPGHHRVHHAVNPEYLDRNFGGVLIIWDRMFGTFQAMQRGNPARFGLVQQLGEFNILRCIFHEWLAICRDVVSAPWPDKLNYIFGSPGWCHDGSRKTTAQIKEHWRQKRLSESDGALRPAAEYGHWPQPVGMIADDQPAQSR
jgi:sterol desaturase/sphingolipid hydroxylase (fatty acid hydroxylase superfamily)